MSSAQGVAIKNIIDAPGHLTQHCVCLPRSPHAPAVARHAAAGWLTAGGSEPCGTWDVLLVVSELVTNALRHTSGPCTLTLTARGTMVDIAVTDASQEPPHAGCARYAGEQGGFGLAMLTELGARVSVEPEPRGKTVHAALNFAAAAPRLWE